MKNFNIRYLFLLAVISFGLHIFWENLQAPLYAGFVSFSDHFLMCFRGTLGDVSISVGAFFFMILIKQTTPLQLNRRDFIILAILGFVIAVVIEQNALLMGKWAYTSMMPLLPFLRVGLAPIAQMTILLPLSFYLAQKLSKSATPEVICI